MLSFIERPLSPNSVQCSCNSAIIVTTALMLAFLLVFLASAKLRTLFGRWTGSKSAFVAPIPYNNIRCITVEQASTTSSLEASLELKDARIRALEMSLGGQKRRFERELFESQAENRFTRSKAAAELAQKEEEMRALANDCRKVLDPKHEYPADMSVYIVAKLGAVRRGKVERDMKRRENSLRDGGLVEELESTRKFLKDQAHAHQTEIRKNTKHIAQLSTDISQLSDKTVEQKFRIKALNDQLNDLIETKIELDAKLLQANQTLGEEKNARADLEKVVIELNGQLSLAKRESVTLETQLREITDTLEAQSKRFTAVMDEYEEQYAEKSRECWAAEFRVENLRAKVEEVKSKQWQEMIRLRKQGIMNEGTDAKSSKSGGKVEQDAQVPCNHEGQLRAAVDKEEKLTSHVWTLESQIAKMAPRIAELEQQLATAANTSQTADRDAEVAKQEAQSLRNQLTALATDLQAHDPKSVTLSDCVQELERKIRHEAHSYVHSKEAELQALKGEYDVSREELQGLQKKRDSRQKEVQELRKKSDNNQEELQELRQKYDTSQTQIKNINIGRANVIKDLKDKEAECHNLQCELRDAKLAAARRERTATDTTR